LAIIESFVQVNDSIDALCWLCNLH